MPKLNKSELAELTGKDIPKAEPDTRERPYWDGRAVATLPPVEIFREVYRRAGGPELVTDEERQALRKTQRKIDRLSKEISAMTLGEIITQAKAARARIAGGAPLPPDFAFVGSNGGVQAGIEKRKALKKQRRALIDQSRAALASICDRIQTHARKVLPQIVAERSQAAESLGMLGGEGAWKPENDHFIRAVGLVCWSPAVVCQTADFTPKNFLRQLGIKL